MAIPLVDGSIYCDTQGYQFVDGLIRVSLLDGTPSGRQASPGPVPSSNMVFRED